MLDEERSVRLEQLSGEPSPALLADLLDIEITGDTAQERLENYLAQVGDPYRFRVGKTAVRVLFREGEKPLEEKLQSYFISLKNDGNF